LTWLLFPYKCIYVFFTSSYIIFIFFILYKKRRIEGKKKKTVHTCLPLDGAGANDSSWSRKPVNPWVVMDSIYGRHTERGRIVVVVVVVLVVGRSVGVYI
jgi:hypothetical protein